MQKFFLSFCTLTLALQLSIAQDFNTNYTTITHKSNAPLIPWNFPAINFQPDGVFHRAGDINGDGKDDLVLFFGRQFIADERTESPEDFTNKSLVFYGGNITNIPDQVIYAELSPVGDLNGDGFDDAIGQNLDDTLSYYFGSATGYQINASAQTDFLTFLTPVGFKDFNGDGFEDVLIHNITIPVNQLTILFGGSTLEDFTLKDYSLENAGFLQPVRLNSDVLASIRPVNEDDLIHTAILSISPEDLSLEVTFEQSLSFDFINNFSSSQWLLNPVDINADGLEDIYIPGLQENGEVHDNMVIIASSAGYGDFALLSSPLSERIWLPIGDTNGDQKTDFARLNADVLEIALTPDDLQAGLTPTNTNINFSSADALFDLNISIGTDTPSFYDLGDFNGDGIDDFYVKLYSDNSLGYKIVNGSANVSALNFHDKMYEFGEFKRLANLGDAKNVGDINDDGIEDFALLFADRTDIFFGSEIHSTPDISLPTRLTGNFHFENGDFDGDGQIDLIVSSIEPGPSFNVRGRSRIDIYLGKDGFDNTPDITFLDTDFPPTAQFAPLFRIHNIGDFNDDGFEDFFVSYIRDDTSVLIHLIYGGNNISASGSVALNVGFLDLGIPNLYTGNMVRGWRFEKLGDINGDNIDDFALSDISRRYISSAFENSGSVLIYFGTSHTAGTRSLSLPDEVLILDDIRFKDFDGFGHHIVAGDFNGDGHNDLLASSVRTPGASSGSTSTEGTDGILIYHGGPDFDNQIDQQLGIPLEPFGSTDFTRVSRLFGDIEKVPDINADGADEILITSPEFGLTNAILIMGGQGIQNELTPAITFEAPNKGSRLGMFSTLRETAIGDFDGDGATELLLPQLEDRNYRNTPIYFYPVESPFIVASLEDRSIENRVNLYPNPAIDVLTVSLENLSGFQPQSLSLVGLDGNVINSVKLSPLQQEVKLDVASLNEGMYLVLIHTDRGTLTRKVLKQH